MNRDDIIQEIHDVRRDLETFREARDCFQRRKLELEDRPERLNLLKDWPVFAILENAFVMGLVRCEGLLEEYQTMLAELGEPDNVVSFEVKRNARDQWTQ